MIVEISARRITAVLLLCLGAAFSAGSARAAAHSASHKIPAAAPPADGTTRAAFAPSPQVPLGLAVKSDRWEVYSRGVNRINACAVHGALSWLATDMGVKLVDRTHSTVTHYTRLDGLPGTRVTAVGASDEGAWAIVSMQHDDGPKAAICEYRRATNRWAVLREIPRPVFSASVPAASGQAPTYTPGSPVETALTAVCPEKLCFAVGPVRREQKSLAYCYDRRLHLWDEIPLDPAFLNNEPSLSLTWMDVDRDGVWLGTTAGLLRYRLREKQWQRWLPDRMVYAGTKADDGTLWLVTYLNSSALAPAAASVAGAAPVTVARWAATHFVPKTGATRNYAAPDGANRQFAYGSPAPVTYGGISLADGCVWLSPGSRAPFIANRPFERLYPRDEVWRTYAGLTAADMSDVPDAALEQQTLPRATLLLDCFPWRLTQWMCRDEIPAQPIVPGPRAQGRDSDGTLWTTDRRAIVHMDQKGVSLARYGLSSVEMLVTPAVSAVGTLNGVLYVLSGGELHRYDSAAAEWQRVLLPRGNWSNPTDERLIATGNRLLVGTSYSALLFDPASQLFSVAASSANSGFRVLSPNDTGLWLRGPDSLLYRSDPRAGDPEPVDVAALPARLAEQYDRPAPFAATGSLVWFRFAHKSNAEKCLYIGYDPAVRTWTAGYEAVKAFPVQPSCFAVGARIYFAISEDKSAVQCFDTAAGTWTSVAGAEPSGRGRYTLSIVSADDSEIWASDSNTRSLLCFHRGTNSWTVYDAPQGFWVQPTGNEVVKSGSSIFLATNDGVWRFQVDTHVWTHLPGFVSRDIYLDAVWAGPAAVWTIGRPNGGNQALAVRMDRNTHAWTAWSDREGFPERSYPQGIVPDGSTAWTIAGGECYHLDPGANRWYNASERIARLRADGSIGNSLEGKPTGHYQITSVEPDGDSVWLLPGALVGGPAAPGARSLIVRYDKTTGRFERLDPAPEKALTGQSIQVDARAVWVPTPAGVYRYDKRERSWRKVEPPAEAEQEMPLTAQSVVQREGDTWFFGSDGAVRWRD